MGTEMGGGCSPPAGLGWGAPAWGPLAEPTPIQRAVAAAGLKMNSPEGPAKSPRNPERAELFLGEGVSQEGGSPTGCTLSSPDPQGALPGTGHAKIPTMLGTNSNPNRSLASPRPCEVNLLSPLEAQRGKGLTQGHHSLVGGLQPSVLTSFCPFFTPCS